MRSLTKSNPKTRQSQDRETNRKPKHRRLLEIEVLEDRLPVSEQLGTALGVSALSYIGGLTARLAVPLLAEQQQSAKVRAEEPSKASGIAVVWPSATSESTAARAALASGQLMGTMGPAQGSHAMPVAAVGIKELGPKPFYDLT